MSVLDKKLLSSDIQSVLDNYIPANSVRKIMEEIGEKLTRYEVTTKPGGDGGGQDENDQLIQLYVDAKSVDGLSEKTIARYKYILDRMSKGISVPIRKITVHHLRQYIISEKNRGVCNNTIKGSVQIWKGFFNWLQHESIIQINPAANLGSIKAKREEEPPFTSEEIQLIKESCEDDRELALVHFLLSTGCRVSELCSVNRADIDYQNLRLSVTGKGDKTRTVYIDNVTAMMLQRYVSGRKDFNPALFLGRGEKRLEIGGVEKILRGIGSRSHVPGVHPHRFRHTFATNMVDRGMEIQEVSALLGHCKLDTTMTYVKVNQRNTENNYRRFACM